MKGQTRFSDYRPWLQFVVLARIILLKLLLQIEVQTLDIKNLPLMFYRILFLVLGLSNWPWALSVLFSYHRSFFLNLIDILF